MKPEKFNKIQKIREVKGAMLKCHQSLQLILVRLKTKLVGSHIHQLHQLMGFLNNGFAIPPCKDRSKKSCNFYILFFCEQVRDTNGIIRNEGGLIVLVHFPVKKIF